MARNESLTARMARREAEIMARCPRPPLPPLHRPPPPIPRPTRNRIRKRPALPSNEEAARGRRRWRPAPHPARRPPHPIHQFSARVPDRREAARASRSAERLRSEAEERARTALRDKERALERAANSTTAAAAAYVQKREAELKFVFASRAATEAKQSAEEFAAKCDNPPPPLPVFASYPFPNTPPPLLHPALRKPAPAPLLCEARASEPVPALAVR